MRASSSAASASAASSLVLLGFTPATKAKLAAFLHENGAVIGAYIPEVIHSPTGLTNSSVYRVVNSRSYTPSGTRVRTEWTRLLPAHPPATGFVLYVRTVFYVAFGCKQDTWLVMADADTLRKAQAQFGALVVSKHIARCSTGACAGPLGACNMQVTSR